MNIVIGSAFRNSSGYLSRYLRQVMSLAAHAGPSHSVRVIAAEGDSTDLTREILLQTLPVGSTVVNVSHGQRWFGSTEELDRMQAMSAVGNAIFSAVNETDDVLVYVESDLIWDVHTIGTFIDLAMRRQDEFDVFSPMTFAGDAFYDIWGFRKNGERFVGCPPYHIALTMGQLCEMDSVGSCLVMRAKVARECRINDGNCLVGWCGDARSKGYRIATLYHPSLIVRHPA